MAIFYSYVSLPEGKFSNDVNIWDRGCLNVKKTRPPMLNGMPKSIMDRWPYPNLRRLVRTIKNKSNLTRFIKFHIWIMVHNYTTITYNPSTLSAWHTTTTLALDVICQGAERKVPRHHSRNRVQRSWAPFQKRYSKFWDRMEYREVFGDCIYIYICNYMCILYYKYI